MASPQVHGRLTNEESARYSRQLILPGFEVMGQLQLKNSSAIIVGAGGLGCPVGIYLAGAGLGKIGIVDYDVVATSNLHRQVQHHELRIGHNKAVSLQEQLLALNSLIEVVAIELIITSGNALDILRPYDVIIDASDNMATRYLLNDAAVLLGKPLVSGSALRWEGQLTVYNYGVDGPCYRCIFPTPPSPHAVTNCNDGGIIGAITGVIGSLQALEAILVLLGRPNYCKKLFLFDGSSGLTKTFALRPRRASCEGCGPNDSPKSLSLISLSERIMPMEYYTSIKDRPHLLVDVRNSVHYNITHLNYAKNLPLAEFDAKTLESLGSKDQLIICLCRRGNDSQRAVVKFKEFGFTNVRDIIGGIYAMALIDESLARY